MRYFIVSGARVGGFFVSVNFLIRVFASVSARAGEAQRPLAVGKAGGSTRAKLATVLVQGHGRRRGHIVAVGQAVNGNLNHVVQQGK